MQTKDFDSKSGINAISNDVIDNEKYIENQNKVDQRVDINVLKSRLREKEKIYLFLTVTMRLSCCIVKK